jgi:hypothetical protein
MDDDLASRLLLHARGRLDRHGEALPAPLDRVYADVRDEWLDKIGGGGAEELFLGPWGTPAFPLLAWVAEGCLDPTDGQPARDAAEAMLAWYLALRCQDDVVDEDAPAERIYLEQALAAHAVGLLVQAAGDAGQMLAVWSRVTTDFAAYALHDARLQARSDSTWSEADLAKQGRKYLPMAAPPAALLIRAGRADQVDRLIDALVRMATGLQLTNDLRGVRRDLAAGLASPYTASVCSRGCTPRPTPRPRYAGRSGPGPGTGMWSASSGLCATECRRSPSCPGSGWPPTWASGWRCCRTTGRP